VARIRWIPAARAILAETHDRGLQGLAGLLVAEHAIAKLVEEDHEPREVRVALRAVLRQILRANLPKPPVPPIHLLAKRRDDVQGPIRVGCHFALHMRRSGERAGRSPAWGR